MTHKKTLAVLSAAMILGTGLSAQAAFDDHSERRSHMVQALAERLGVSEEKVQQALEEVHAAKKAERDAKRAERVQKLVADGVLTQAQADALEARHAEMRAEREENKEALKNMSREERKAVREEKRAAFEAWAQSQGIDLTKLKEARGDREHKGPHHGHKRF